MIFDHHNRRTTDQRRASAPAVTTTRTPVQAQCVQLPAFDRDLLELPIYIPKYMAWTDEHLALELSILEAIRLLLGDETSALVLVADVRREANALLVADGRADPLNRRLTVSIIRAWAVFPLNAYALECTPRRLSAVIQLYRDRSQASTGIERLFLPLIGTGKYLDRITDNPLDWQEGE